MAERGTLRAVALTWQPLGTDHPLLDDVNIEIGAGQRVLLAGVSGAGKSSLLRAFAGVLEDHTPGQLSGEVTVGGLPAVAGRGDVVLTGQQPFDSIVAETVERDVAFGPENLGLPVTEIHDRIAEALELVDFPFLPGHPTAALSGGQAQRLALAGALAMKPDVFLLDEPGVMLDAPSAARLRDAVNDVVVSTGATLVVADHDIAGWNGIVERLVVIDAGRVLADGPFEEVVETMGARLLELGLWIPGAPDPEPVAVDLERNASRDLGDVMAQARGITVDRRSPLTLKSTREAKPRRVLCDVDVELRQGELVALNGDSGAGKSTLLAALLGTLPVTSGEVRVGGDDPARLTSRQLAARAGWVPQFAEGLVVGNTVLSSLTATALVLGGDREDVEVRARRLLAAVGLGDMEDRHPLSLSGGEQRRLAVVSSVLHTPGVLLADEPTVGLDRVTWAAVVGVLLSAREAGIGVLVATHDAALTRLADRRIGLPSPPAAEEERSPTAKEGAGARGLLGRSGPLSLLLGAVFFTISGVIAGDLLPLTIGVTVLVVVGMVLLRFRFLLGRLAAPGIAIASIAWSNWLLSDPRAIEPALVAALRVAFIVLPGVVAASFLEPTALGDHLGGRLRLPSRLVLAVIAALRWLDGFAELWQEISRARRVRGVGSGRSPLSKAREWGALCLALLVASVRQAGRLTIAMDSRGYSAPGPRTWLGEAAWTREDTVLVVIAASLAILPHLLGALI